MSNDEKKPPEEQLPLKERLYSKIKIPLKLLDAIIIALILLTIVVIIVGTMKGGGRARMPKQRAGFR